MKILLQKFLIFFGLSRMYFPFESKFILKSLRIQSLFFRSVASNCVIILFEMSSLVQRFLCNAYCDWFCFWKHQIGEDIFHIDWKTCFHVKTNIVSNVTSNVSILSLSVTLNHVIDRHLLQFRNRKWCYLIWFLICRLPLHWSFQ